MKTVKVYIETTITGPFVRDGKYGAALVFIKQNGEVKDLFVQGEETETTHNRSVLLAMIRAMQRFTEPCHIIFYTRNTFIRDMVQADNPEKWRRAEWRKSDGKDIQNKKQLEELYNCEIFKDTGFDSCTKFWVAQGLPFTEDGEDILFTYADGWDLNELHENIREEIRKSVIVFEGEE